MNHNRTLLIHLLPYSIYGVLMLIASLSFIEPVHFGRVGELLYDAVVFQRLLDYMQTFSGYLSLVLFPTLLLLVYEAYRMSLQLNGTGSIVTRTLEPLGTYKIWGKVEGGTIVWRWNIENYSSNGSEFDVEVFRKKRLPTKNDSLLPVPSVSVEQRKGLNQSFYTFRSPVINEEYFLELISKKAEQKSMVRSEYVRYFKK